MDGVIRRGLLAAAVGMGVLAGLARGQQPAPPPVVLEPAPAAAAPGAGVPDAAPASHWPRIHAWFQRHNACCYGNINNPGCGSLKSECVFIFGSCRAFWGEPCLDRPPVPPVPVSELVNRARLSPDAVGGRGCPWCR